MCSSDLPDALSAWPPPFEHAGENDMDIGAGIVRQINQLAICIRAQMASFDEGIENGFRPRTQGLMVAERSPYDLSLPA